MKHTEFLFDFSLAQILLLLDRRADRMNRPKASGPAPQGEMGTIGDLRSFFDG